MFLSSFRFTVQGRENLLLFTSVFCGWSSNWHKTDSQEKKILISHVGQGGVAVRKDLRPKGSQTSRLLCIQSSGASCGLKAVHRKVRGAHVFPAMHMGLLTKVISGSNSLLGTDPLCKFF